MQKYFTRPDRCTWANCNLRILKILKRSNFQNKSRNRRFPVFLFGLRTFLLRCLLRAWNQFGYVRREAAYLFGQLDIQEISIWLENNLASNLFFIRRSDKLTEESVSRKQNCISAIACLCYHKASASRCSFSFIVRSQAVIDLLCHNDLSKFTEISCLQSSQNQRD